MRFNVIDCLLQGAIERDTSRAEDKLVQALPMFRLDNEARANVLVHEGVVENSHRFGTDRFQGPVSKYRWLAGLLSNRSRYGAD